MTKQELKDNIILELTELHKLDAVDSKIIEQTKAGKFDKEIESFDDSYSVTQATDAICDAYRFG